MSGRLFKFPQPDSDGAIGAPEGWVVVAGAPKARTWCHYTSEDGTALSGLWECTPGSFDVAYDDWEFCHLISGACTITREHGTPVGLKAGDGFVLEPGFKGRWEVTETMTKHFVFTIQKSAA